MGGPGSSIRRPPTAERPQRPVPGLHSRPGHVVNRQARSGLSGPYFPAAQNYLPGEPQPGVPRQPEISNAGYGSLGRSWQAEIRPGPDELRQEAERTGRGLPHRAEQVRAGQR
jgi:hypothetical protein